MPAWSPTELDVMRIGLGLVVIKTFSSIQVFRPTGEPPFPMGVARVVSVRWATSQLAARWLQYGAYVAALCLAAQVLVPFALVYLAAATMLEVTFRSSYGAVNHGHHLLAIVLLVQATSVLLWNAAAHWDWDLSPALAGSQQTTAAWWTVQAIVAVYFTSGLSKVINSGGQWIRRSPALLLDAYGRIDTDEMTRKGGSKAPRRSDGLISWLFDKPTLTRWIFAGGLLVELTAPIGLLGKTVLLAMGVALIVLHKGNRGLLGLPFPEYQLIVFIYLVNVPQFL